MSKNKWYVALLISLILMVIFYVSNGMLNVGKREEYYSVAVILDNSGSDRWNAFKEGLEQAVADKNIYLNVVSTGKFLSLEEECSIISRELENGADGMIVGLCADDKSGLLDEAVSSNPVVLVGNSMESETLYTTVAPDQYRLGKAIGEAVLAGESRDLAERKIGILSGNQEKMGLRQRLEGVQEVLSEAGVELEWIISRKEAASLRQCYAGRPVDILITLDNDETELAVDFLLEQEEYSCRIYGEGRSEQAVYYLDKGMIQTLIVSNEFYMGYQSVEFLAQKLNYFTSVVEHGEVDFLTVTGDNLYDEEVEKILFPTVR